MSTFTGSSKLALRLRKKIRSAPIAVQSLLIQVEIKGIIKAKEMSSGPYSYPYLRSPLDYPYSLANPKGDPLGEGDYAMVSYHGGETPGPHIRDSWGVSVRKRSNGYDYIVVFTNSSPHMKFLVAGRRGAGRMVDRPLQRELNKYIRRVYGSYKSQVARALTSV